MYTKRLYYFILFSISIICILLITMATLRMQCVCSVSVQSEVEKAFIENKIVPDILTVAPKGALNVSYPSGVKVDLGKELTPTQVKDKPQVTWNAEKGAYYTLMMVDPDGSSRTNHSARETRHWLVMNILGTAVESGDEVTEYRGSGPPKATGLHRYIFLVFKQPNGLIMHKENHTPSNSREHRKRTSAMALAEKYKLGNPEFGNFYQAQYDAYVDILRQQNVRGKPK